MAENDLEKLAKLVRYFILTSTTAAGSGHPTSSLSAADLMTGLFFKYFRFDMDHPENINNDRLIFSKGHASPLLYALYAAAGKLAEKRLLKLRRFDSPLEGHPTPRFKFTEAATGSLGQGLSVGVGMAIAMRVQAQSSKFKAQKLPYVYVLLGDGEMAEGSVWEAIEIAVYYKLNNLIGIVDMNRLGQSQETMLGHNLDTYANRAAAFGWQVIKLTDGHDLEMVDKAFELAVGTKNKPVMIIAKTIKGKGVSFLEDQNGWHGKALTEVELKQALEELGMVDRKVRGLINKPLSQKSKVKSLPAQAGQNYKLKVKSNNTDISYKKEELVATREAYGSGLIRLGKIYSDVVVLDGDVKNSTYADKFVKEFPDRFWEMFIAEQNMVGTAVGLAKLGLVPFVSSFACFLTRAYDQIRMASYSQAKIVFCGSHAGVSIGEDGPSQMGLEDLAMFRSIFGSTIFYPADAVATEKLVKQAYQQKGIVYIRTTRPKTPVIYAVKEEFPVGGSKIHRIRNSAKVAGRQESRNKESATVVAAGITLYEALKAQEQLKQQGIAVRVIDCYSIKPIDVQTLKIAARETGKIITVEDHYSQGGLGDAVLEALADVKDVQVYKLAVTKTPKSGKPEQLLAYEAIDARGIVEKVRGIIEV